MAGASPLFAAPDFWNKKDPKDWSSEEIDRLTTSSPWAKEVTGSFVASDRGGVYDPGVPSNGPSRGGSTRPSIGLGIPGIGLGYPRTGGGYPGGGGGSRRSPSNRDRPYPVKGTVLWESAQPVLDALMPELPDGFQEHYVINLSGFPWPDRDEDDNDALEPLKKVTYLQAQSGKSIQPGVIQRPITSGRGSILFGFSRRDLDVSADIKEVQFTTRLGRTPVQAKFVPKEMMYRGKIAV